MRTAGRILLTAALLLAVAGTVAVSCQKSGEEDVPEVGAENKMPEIQPMVYPVSERFTIQADGTIISYKSIGYSFDVLAKAVTFKDFTCYLVNEEKFFFSNDCNLTLHGDSTITLVNRGFFGGHHITLSGSGSITFKKMGSINETDYNNMFSAAEGYTLTSTGAVDEGNTWYSCTWTVDKSK